MADRERYARHIALAGFGADGQDRLAATSVLIVGLGGLGCPAAQYLASSGIGRLVLNDYDRVDRSNLPRQVLFSDDDVGRLKIEAAAERLTQMNPELATDLLPERLDDAGFRDAIDRVDIVLDCVDNFATRLAINRAAVATATPLVSGAALRFEGQIAVFANRPGDACYRCLYSEDDELLGNCEGNGVLAPVPGVIGTLMAVEAISLAIAAPREPGVQLRIWDALSGDWQSVRLARDPACPVCGTRD